MLKLLFGRALPAGVAAWLLTSAVSPLQPALRAFGIAANALGGENNLGGVDMPHELPESGGFFASLFAPKGHRDDARRQIEGLVENLKDKKAHADAEAGAQKNQKKKSKKGKGGKKKDAEAPPAGPKDALPPPEPPPTPEAPAPAEPKP